MFPSDFIDRLREASDLPAIIIGDGVPLKKVGAHEWKAICPFHAEDSPSFTVNDAKGLFHCFGCNTSGDVFEWLKRKGVEFPDAVRMLAGKIGMMVPEDTRPVGAMAEHPALVKDAAMPGLHRLEVPPPKPAAAQALQKDKFRTLAEGSAVWRYLTETRKLPAEIVRLYAPKETHSKEAFYGRAPEDWAAVGFVYRDPALPREKNAEVIKCLDLERELRVAKDGTEKRVKVEWRHPQGRRSILYGMQVVPATATELVICEGEIDAMSWSAYDRFAVSVPSGAASLGWIETCWHWLERFQRIYLSFDSDAAGQSKLLEAAERLGNERVKLVRMPEKNAVEQRNI
jgi:hypothetical protein